MPAGDHFYTTSAPERDNAAIYGYKPEGTTCYVFDLQAQGTTPLYRLFRIVDSGEIASLTLSNVHFDLAHAVLGSPQVESESTQDLTNTTSVEQQETFTFELDYTETKSWSSTIGVKVGIQTTIQTGIPFIVGGNIQVSVEGSYSYTWGAQKSTTRKYTDAIPVKVPAHSHVICEASASTARVTIPYSADAVYHFTSGQDIPGNFTGTYEGATAYQLQASWTEPQSI